MKNVSLLGFTTVNIGELPLCLPLPNEGNTGGYTNWITGEFMYSPIDTAIAGLEQLYVNPKISITNLNDWFISNSRNKMSENHVYLTFYYNTVINSFNVLYLKMFLSYLSTGDELQNLLLRNAPFTFRT